VEAVHKIESDCLAGLLPAPRFINRKRLYERTKALGDRAKVHRVTPHCFRDTFACDMLARGASIYDVAKMLADTVESRSITQASYQPLGMLHRAKWIAESVLRSEGGLQKPARGQSWPSPQAPDFIVRRYC
jgi:hypothetical protein